MKSGIYEIRNVVNGKRYIGSTRRLKKRWQEHLNRLRHQQHHNQYLQRAFNKYGEAAFVLSVLEHIDKASQLIPREQYYVDALKPEYNIGLIVTSPMSGRHHSEETRAKISEAGKGKRLSLRTKQKLSEANSGEGNPNYGKHPTLETRRKLSEAHKGKRHHNYGKHLSETTRRKISEAQSGARGFWYGKSLSAETKRKMSKAQKARWHRIRMAKKAGKI